MTEEERPSERPPVDAFDDALSALGDDTRLAILLELAAEANETGMGAGLSFSELRERVGVADSGRFNYHLDRLRGQFVAKVDGEYAARYPGLAVAAATYAGTYRDADDAAETAGTEFTCPRCGDPAEVHYGRDTLFSGVWMECPEHGAFDRYPVPPGGRHGRSLSETLEAAYLRAHTNFGLARQGVCLECWGSTTVTYPVEVDAGGSLADEFVFVEVSCGRCWNRLSPPLRSLLSTHPLLWSAFYERGYTPQAAAQAMTDPDGAVACETDLEATDPPRATVRVGFDDETVAVTVDEDCSVLDYRRE
jgi:DNA-binding transcriptional ArsR family regulator